MIRKLLAGTALCSLGILLAGCTNFLQPQMIGEEELTGEMIQNETGDAQTTTGENILEETFPALADNMSLSLELRKGWQGTTTQGNTNSNPPYAIPLQVSIKNTSKKELARVRPRLDDQGEMQQAPSMIVMCKSTDEDHIEFGQNIFSFFPGVIAAGAQRPYTPKVIQSTNWTDVLIGANGEVTVQTLGWNPRFIHATTLQEGETIEGVLHLTCKLFVSTQAGINACGCHIDENPELTDTACFQSCYPNIDTQSSAYARVDFSTPSAARTKVDESSIQLPYTGIATKCDFGCDMEYSFSL